jgi:hypothetical protein
MKQTDEDIRIDYIGEPRLIFGHGQISDHPKDGLYLYGPHSGPDKPKELSIGVIGTKSGLSFFRNWSIKLGGYISIPPPGKMDKENRLHLSNFPGIEEAFNITISPAEFTECKIDYKKLDEATSVLNQHEAVRKAVDLYVSEIEYHDSNEERTIDVWIFVLPELVFERCKPLAKRTGIDLKKGEFSKKQKQREELPLFAGVIDQSDEEIFDDVPDFHRQVKARLLKLGHPSQLIRETTLAPEEFLNSAGYQIRQVQDSATVAWNLSAGLYYKTQPEPPWKLANIRPGVCYIGLVFKVIPNHPKKYACCAAQMFLNEGDAVVFRGANGPWKTNDYEYHLHPQEAKQLIKKVIETFCLKHGEMPKELFIHGKTSFNDAEWEAFKDAAPPETNVVGVRIKTTTGDIKLYRNGDYPTLRGTTILLNKKNAYLWSTGYVPRIDSYIGPETPNPLFVTILRSTVKLPSIKQVLTDILGLTKINYNACNYNDGLPVTIRFANKVGEVLIMGSAKDAERQPLKYYI